MTYTPGCFKRFLFRNYGWIAGATFVISLILIATIRGPLDWRGVGTSLAGSVAFLFAVQKQKLDELKVFLELFRSFNERYDKLNDRLNSILDPTAPVDRGTLNEYFNLCGEEYLLYREGFIHPDVWDAWRRGMKFFYANERIGRVWDEELSGGCYYGLTRAILEGQGE